MRAPSAWLRQDRRISWLVSGDDVIRPGDWGVTQDTPLYTVEDALRVLIEEYPEVNAVETGVLERILTRIEDTLRPEPPVGAVVRTNTGRLFRRMRSSNAYHWANAYGSECSWAALEPVVVAVYQEVS